MPKTNKQRGHHYEQLAAQYLQRNGYQILQQNFYCKGGEIDLIALKAETLVFIEVKYRKTNLFGDPSEFVSISKQKKLMQCAQVYLQKNANYQKHNIRLDVMTFCGDQLQPQWIENAFGGW